MNLLRTSILFLMLYLIFTQRITVGQFFSLFIYSFFIFGPLQELGNVINTYRETEVSLQNFETILNLPAGAAAGASGGGRSRWKRCSSTMSISSTNRRQSAGAGEDCVSVYARGDDRVCGAVGRRGRLRW